MRNTDQTERDLEEFVAGYVECALWSCSIEEDFAAQHLTETGEDIAPDTGLDSFGFTADDIALEAMESMRADCRDFLESNATDLKTYSEEMGPWHGTDSRGYCDDPAMARAGHDFWLTRNHHGAGFFDRGLGELGDRLTAVCKPYGETDLYVGDDGKLYVS